MNHKLSVVMSVYNGEDFLKEAIESILNQTYKDFELIIIDDGSIDNSLNIINEYAKNDIRIKIISRENKGLIYSLNEGIKISKGEYIARMDADDICMSERFEKQVRWLDSNKDIDIAGTYIECIGEADNFNFEKYENDINKQLDDKLLLERTIESCPLVHPTVMYRRKFIIDIGGYYEYETAEDNDLWIRAAGLGYKMQNIPEKLLKYRMLKSSMSHGVDNEKFLSILIRCKLEFLKKYKNLDGLNYLIWGASNGGKISNEVLKNQTKNSKCIGYIDSFKTGDINGINIFMPESIEKLQFDYIFIATSPGKKNAEAYLNSLGFKFLDKYLYIV